MFFPNFRALHWCKTTAIGNQIIEGLIKLATVQLTTVFLNVSLQSYRRDVKFQRVRHSLQLSCWVQNESSKQMFHLVNAFCFTGSVTSHNALRETTDFFLNNMYLPINWFLPALQIQNWIVRKGIYSSCTCSYLRLQDRESCLNPHSFINYSKSIRLPGYYKRSIGIAPLKLWSHLALPGNSESERLGHRGSESRRL